jgi:hypothetical protein
MIDLRCRAPEALNFPLRLGDPTPRFIEARDFLLCLLRQVRKLGQHPRIARDGAGAVRR